MSKRRVVVIGGGVGGYPAAIRAARLGAEVTLIEKARLGGVCLNTGCIPTKVLLHAASLRSEIKQAGVFGVQAELTSFDFGKLQERKAEVIHRLTSGVEQLLRSKKVSIIEGSATFVSDHAVQIEQTGQIVEGDVFIIATGSIPVQLELQNESNAEILTSDELLEMSVLPKSILIIGGGYIAVEFGQFLQRMGTDVTLVEMQSRIIPLEDEDISGALDEALCDEGLKILTGAQVQSIKAASKGRKKVVLSDQGGEMEITVDAIAQAVGRRPHWGGLSIETAGVKTQNGRIVVDDKMQTNVAHIYAVGDVTGGIMLAHVAIAEGECAAHNAMNLEESLSLKAVPRCVYTSPEVACVGLSEADAKKKYGNVKAVKYPLSSTGKAVLMNHPKGMVKIVASPDEGEILGVHIVGPRATEMIAEAVLAIEMELTANELAHTIHPHPTISEAVQEASMMLVGGAIHLP